MRKILTLLILTATTLAHAWGEKGHAMVAQVAFSYLNEKTKDNVRAYLDGMSIEDAANWMDHIKSDKTKHFMKPFHYANFEKGEKVHDREGANIVYVLNTTITGLSSKDKLSKEEIKEKILFLLHLVGDLHQCTLVTATTKVEIPYSCTIGGREPTSIIFGILALFWAKT